MFVAAASLAGRATATFGSRVFGSLQRLGSYIRRVKALRAAIGCAFNAFGPAFGYHCETSSLHPENAPSTLSASRARVVGMGRSVASCNVVLGTVIHDCLLPAYCCAHKTVIVEFRGLLRFAQGARFCLFGRHNRAQQKFSDYSSQLMRAMRLTDSGEAAG
jgi:hypothetical protein